MREMKQAGKSKAEWQPEVNRLLELKKELSALTGEPAAAAKPVRSLVFHCIIKFCFPLLIKKLDDILSLILSYWFLDSQK